MSVRLKKNLERLKGWASGASRPLEPSRPVVSEADVPAKKDAPANAAYEAGCAGKERYPSKQAAGAAQVYREQSGVRNEGMVAYACRFCGGWHLGHQKP